MDEKLEEGEELPAESWDRTQKVVELFGSTVTGIPVVLKRDAGPEATGVPVQLALV